MNIRNQASHPIYKNILGEIRGAPAQCFEISNKCWDFMGGKKSLLSIRRWLEK